MSKPVLDFERLEKVAEQQRDAFAAAEPFPHCVLDDFLDPDVAGRVLAEFQDTAEGWDHYHHYNEKKQAVTSLDPLGPATREVFEALQSRRFVDFVEGLTGVDPLVSDPELDGAGLHRVFPGGFLNVHTDFLAHTTNRNWSRQINLLLYFNPRWEPEWDGALELWDPEVSRCVRSVEPVFNRCVIFHTTAESYHGHPRPLRCPEGEFRKSLALYYFREENESQGLTPTHYRALPSDSLLKRGLVAADRMALRSYSFVKRYTGVSDGVVSRILKRF